ncbi:MAG: MBL fold metallo-hydrolase, partial [Planctomycetia bacterium]|nr:MBL fold metallo-hydrolase [Planctomycetia bacterium]
MRVVALQSGSNGNCVYVESDDVRLLVDAGIPGYIAQQRLAAIGRDIKKVQALLISHEHADHVRCMGVFHRKFSLPIHITKNTLAAARSRCDLGGVNNIQPFAAGEKLQFGHVTVETVPTPHDAVEGVAFVIDDGRRRLGVLTDLGHVFSGLADVVASLDAVLIESNYDPDMLARGSY